MDRWSAHTVTRSSDHGQRASIAIDATACTENRTDNSGGFFLRFIAWHRLRCNARFLVSNHHVLPWTQSALIVPWIKDRKYGLTIAYTRIVAALCPRFRASRLVATLFFSNMLN